MRLAFHVYWKSQLGQGGEGTVLRARASDGRIVALKVSNARTWLEARRSLMREYERHQRAAGNGVVRIIGYNFDDEIPFIAYELAVQGTLADEMARYRLANLVYHPTVALQRIRSVLAALVAVHDRGVVHRDVKPSNLVFIQDEIKLIDFGLGRTLARPAAFQTIAFVGTAQYASPEQFGPFGYDHRADLYAVGVILYELLMGRRPRRPRIAMHSPSIRWPNITTRLNNLVWFLLADAPQHRPASAAIALSLVDAALDEYARIAIAERARTKLKQQRRLWAGAVLANLQRRVAAQRATR